MSIMTISAIPTAFLESLVATPEPTARVVLLTPELAAHLLDRNPRNRKVSNRNYSIVRRAIQNGEWRLNGEAIKIDKNGLMSDGQHRCLAVVDTGIPIRTFLVEGLESDTQDTMDTGKSRGIADILAIRGEKNAAALAAAIRRVYLFESHGLRAATMSSYPTTNHECLAYYAEHPELADLIIPSKRVATAAKVPASLVSLLMHVFAQVNAEDADYFFDHLATGEDLTHGHPIQVLRESLRKLYDSKGTTNQTYLCALVVKAWNKFRAGETVGTLKFTPGGSSPERFPEPK